jgi:hypothetical protein
MTLRSALTELLSPDAIRSGFLGPRHPEFEVATRRAQIRRIRILLVFGFVFIAIVLLRRMFTGQTAGFVEVLSFVLFSSAYEAAVLAAALRADGQDRSMPLWFWQFNAALEALFPTLALLLIIVSDAFPPQRALVAPMLMIYPYFIVAGVLSLRPSLPLISGAVSAAGYGALVLYVRWAYNSPPDDPLPLNLHLIFVPNLFFLGVVAAWVATLIRGYALAEIHETARRETIEHEFAVAGKIQQGLLPQTPPVLQGFAFAGWNRSVEHAGGDYYDWVALPDGRAAVVLADVSGHGLGPALVAALCRSYLRAVLRQSGSLAESFALVNNLLRDDLPSDWFVTMVVAVAHESEGRVDLFSAGHGPNFVYHSEDGRLETFSADTPPLGVLPELPPATGRSFTLQPGGLLVLASDGFHEWPRDDGARFGVERLQNAIVSRAEQAPAECIAGILAEVETFAGSSAQPDDMSMMVLKRF